MIGTLDKRNKEVTVVGAGIAGMLAAYSLDKQGYQVTLIEEKAKGGGLIQTSATEFGIAESAAHSLIATPIVRDLCSDLNVELIGPRKEASAKFIVRHGKLRRFPLGIGDTFHALRRATFVKSEGLPKQNLDTWARQHLGNAALDYLMTPFVRGIYGVQPSDLGVAAAYPSLSIPKGKTLVGSLISKRRNSSSPKEAKERVAPRYGMGDLVTKLEKRLEQSLGNRFRKNEKVDNVPDAPNVIITAPAYATARILNSSAPELAEALSAVNYTPIVSATVFVARTAFKRAVEGTGVLMPACEDRRSLGILFNSSSFAERVADDSRYASFTVMMGGTLQKHWLQVGDNAIQRAIELELAEVLGICELAALKIHRWPKALPRYSPELPAIWQRAHDTWCARPGKMLFGNWTGQISLRGMIETAAKFAVS